VSGECPSCGYESCVGTSLAYCDAQNTILTELTELRRVREAVVRYGVERRKHGIETVEARRVALESGDEDWRDHQADPRPKWDAMITLENLADALAAEGEE
jgi:hypothetical protein